MKSEPMKPWLAAAVVVARQAGHLLRRQLPARKIVQETAAHDIKLELDVRCQRLIERGLRRAFPTSALFGEEGIAGDPEAEYRWVVDPIDGTVNYAHGIPHACVAIALQSRPSPVDGGAAATPAYRTEVGVVYDPFCEELWTAVRGQRARLNGRPIQVSRRARLGEAVISIGFAKFQTSLAQMLPRFQRLVPRVRKVRIMGSATLDLVYVASGRFDAYLESGVRLWDIAAGGLILECAGGDFWHEPLSDPDYYQVLASNGPLGRALRRAGAGPLRS